MRSVLAREIEVHRLLTNERILGLDLLRGRKTGTGSTDSALEAAKAAETLDPIPASVAALPHPADVDHDAGAPDDEDDESEADTTGLPLFGGEDGRHPGESSD